MPGAPTNVGAAYLFQRQVGGVWSEVLQLQSNDGSSLDRVGETLAIGGDQVFVGATGDEPDGSPLQQVGSVLIFPDVPGCP